MRNLPRASAAFALTILFAAPPAAVAGEAADRLAIEAAGQAWAAAFNARDADAMAAFATDDVVLLDPNEAPVIGRKAARAAWSRTVTAAHGKVSIATKEISLSGNVAWRIGALTQRQPGGAISGRSRFLEIWKRVGYQWKLHRRMPANDLLPLPRLPPKPPLSEPVLDAPVN